MLFPLLLSTVLTSRLIDVFEPLPNERDDTIIRQPREPAQPPADQQRVNEAIARIILEEQQRKQRESQTIDQPIPSGFPQGFPQGPVPTNGFPQQTNGFPSPTVFPPGQSQFPNPSTTLPFPTDTNLPPNSVSATFGGTETVQPGKGLTSDALSLVDQLCWMVLLL